MSFEEMEDKAKDAASFVGYGATGVSFGIGMAGALSYHTGLSLYFPGMDFYGRTYELFLQKLSENCVLAAAANSALHIVIVPALIGFAAYKLVYKIALSDRTFLKSLFE